MRFSTGVSFFTRTLMVSAVLAWPAHAFDIDAIRVRSALGEPLLADIPVDASAEDVRALRAELAPAIVFARVGMARPVGVVTDLRFGVVDGPDGPVIRVTTTAPVREEFFSFLVQLDWAAGRMTREFSVALHPRAQGVSADAMPIAFAVPQAPLDVITRDVAATPPATAAPVPAVAPVPLAGEVASPVALAPRSPAIPEAPPAATPAAAPAAAASRTPASTAPPPRPADDTPDVPDRVNVASGDTLSGIAARAGHRGERLEQALAALLLANPHAFVDGNINRLRGGVVLEMPAASRIEAIPADRARELLAVHARAWREGHAPDAMEAALAALRPASPAPARADTPVPQGRLEISQPGQPAGDAPLPGAGGLDPAGSPMGAAERVASQEVELRHLRAQVRDLEAAGDEMRRLVAAQDQALAQAQARLSTPDPTDPPRRWWWWALAALALPVGLLAGRRYRAAARPDGSAATTAAARPAWQRSPRNPSGRSA